MNRPLNLTATPSFNSYNFYGENSSNAPYYPNFGFQQPGIQYPTNGVNDYMPDLKSPHDFSFSYLNTLSNGTTGKKCTSNESENLTNYGQSNLKHNSAFTYTRPPSSMPNVNTKTSKSTTSSKRVKKSANAEDATNRKRQEFNELIKARTEKLMSDGPVSTVGVNSLKNCLHF